MGEPSEIEIAQADLVKELEKWDVLGVDIGRLEATGGTIRISQRIDALVSLLLEKEVFTEEELDLRFATLATENLKELRKQIEPQVQAVKLANLRKNGGIITPPGFKPKMDD